MRGLVFVILAVFSTYSGWWLYGQNARGNAIENWFASLQSQGWQARGDFEINGFPNRYDIRFDNIKLLSPKRDWAWQNEQFDLVQLSYRPNHLIALWPSTQRIKTPRQILTLKSKNLRSSVVFASQRTLARAVLEGQALSLSGDSGWRLHAEQALFALRAKPELAGDYSIDINIQGLRLGNQLLARLAPNGQGAAQFDRFSLKGAVLYDKPIGLDIFQGHGLQALRVDLQDLHIKWADIALRAKGEIFLDKQGYPSGQLILKLRQWADIIDLARDHGLLNEPMAKTAKSGLDILARLSSDPEQIEITLSFAERKIYLGPILIGPAPAFRLF